MKITLTASILQESDNRFTAWIEEIRGVVAQGETLEEVKSELFKMLNIKLDIGRKENAKRSQVGLTSETIDLVAVA